ncbi:glycosyltransferase [Desulfonatronum sp. SC1]|uniref:glycosyltransferase n=1 Tax=Desulfonatronum sp. SC1 TaxID=2109626 RepID=UPI000D30BAFD|nr:glycosyltransferase [Desulfonatronum sp. SC1]PTN33801.1 hypothetical protein C6366_14025 [Desulfonatronum sp. SC1]
MKIAFICGYPFGLRGTPGTYKFIEIFNKHHNILVLSPPKTKDCIYKNKSIPFIPLQQFNKDDILPKHVISILHAFKPDLFYLFNFPKWPYFFEKLKIHNSSAKCILDIKTPLLAHGTIRKEIQEKCSAVHLKLDGIATLSAESVQTWIPNCTIIPKEYPLGIDTRLFKPKTDKKRDIPNLKFVFIGTLHEKRKIITLIQGFCDFSNKNNDLPKLDIYGSGPLFKLLEEYIHKNNIQNIIKLKGLMSQTELYSILPSYDVGIAWVPVDLYNNSPSLKLIEYIAAGLPVIATCTDAHLKLLSQGFHFNICGDNPASLSEELNSFLNYNIDNKTVSNNIDLVHAFDYDIIFKNNIIPFINNIMHSKNNMPEQHDNPIYANNDIDFADKHIKTYDSAHDTIQDNKYKLKIIILAEMLAAGKGGAERVAMELADEMTRRGHLAYIAYQNKGKIAYTPKNNVVLLPYNDLKILKDQINHIDPDIFFVFYFNRKLITFYSLVHGTKIPFGMQECTNPVRLCTNNWCSIFGKSQSMWEREVIASGATRIRLTMPGYTHSFPEYIQPNVYAFPNPAFQQNILASPVGTSEQRKIILNVNGFKPNKNLITLVQAFFRLCGDFPDWDLKIIGKSLDDKKPHNRDVLHFIEENGLLNRVWIEGPTDDVYAHYASSHIHVIASLSEGCPTVVLEAMSVGLPSIGFADCSGTNELIRHDQNGLLASTEDRISGLENELHKLMSSADIRCRLGSQALEDSKQFDPQKIYDQWEQLLYESAEYKKDPKRLFREQMTIDLERSMHARRMREKLMQNIEI